LADCGAPVRPAIGRFRAGTRSAIGQSHFEVGAVVGERRQEVALAATPEPRDEFAKRVIGPSRKRAPA